MFRLLLKLDWSWSISANFQNMKIFILHAILIQYLVKIFILMSYLTAKIITYWILEKGHKFWYLLQFWKYFLLWMNCDKGFRITFQCISFLSYSFRVKTCEGGNLCGSYQAVCDISLDFSYGKFCMVQVIVCANLSLTDGILSFSEFFFSLAYSSNVFNTFILFPIYIFLF